MLCHRENHKTTWSCWEPSQCPSLPVHTLNYSPSKRHLPHAKQGASRVCFCLFYKLQICTVFNSGFSANNDANITSQTENKMPKTSLNALSYQSKLQSKENTRVPFHFKMFGNMYNFVQLQELQIHVSTSSEPEALRSCGVIKPNEESRQSPNTMCGS